MLVTLAAAASCILVLMGFFAKNGLWCELASHFYVQYAIAIGIQILIVLLGKFYKPVWILVVFLGLCLVRIIPLYVPVQHHGRTAGQTLSVVQINVNRANDRYNDVIQYVLAHDPDVVGFQETDQIWESKLRQALKDKYPSFIGKPQSNNFGILMCAKRRFERSSLENFLEFEAPTAVATVDFDGTKICFVDLHTIPPVDVYAAQARNEQFMRLVKARPTFGDTCVVFGDFNSSSWSAYFGDFVSGIKMYDCRRGFGVQPSWPAHPMPIAFFLRTPIDHTLATENLVTLERSVGDSVGSDHFPIYTKFAIAH